MVSKNAVTPVLEQPVQDYIPGAEWGGAGTDVIAGNDLIKDELLDALVGVPFMVTRFTFRNGIPTQSGAKKDVVAVEVVLAPEDVLRRRRVLMAELPWEPESQLIFNDGSTGIYRQVVAYLAAKGYITLDETKPEEGSHGESRYDVRHADFASIVAGELSVDSAGESVYTVNVRLTCPRGLRLSEYKNDFNPQGSKTRYIA